MVVLAIALGLAWVAFAPAAPILLFFFALVAMLHFQFNTPEELLWVVVLVSAGVAAMLVIFQ